MPTDAAPIGNGFSHLSAPPKEFVCIYAPEDAQYFRELQRYLHLWVREQKIAWLEIRAGDALGEIMERHLRRADLILLLDSADFIATDFTYRAMLKALEEQAQRQVHVIPILARPSAWEETPYGILTALPENRQPIATWLQRDEAYQQIYRGLVRLLPTLQTTDRYSSPVSLASLVPQRRMQVRALPGEYVTRLALLATLKDALLQPGRNQTTAITTALRGAGGFGKTTLALALCHDPTVQAAFPDGIFWLELGEQPPRPLDVFNRLLPELGDTGRVALDMQEARNRWKAVLEHKTCLLIIDDVWQKEALIPLLEGGPHCRRLVTTRQNQVLPATTRRVIVDAMSPDEAITLLCGGLPVEIQQPKAQATLEHLARQLGYWPLLLRFARGLLATRLRYGDSLEQALATVEHIYQGKRGISVTRGEESGFQDLMEASLQASLRQLEALVLPHYQPLDRYQELAIFPEDTDIPLAGLRFFWQASIGLQAWEVDDLCMQLYDLSLLQTCDFRRGTLRLHDVLRTALIQRAGPRLPDLQAHFLDTARRGISLQRWAYLPAANGYLWQHLIWHLLQAQRWEETRIVLSDLRYLTRKVLYVGISELEAEVLLASNPQRGDLISFSSKKHEALATFSATLYRRLIQCSHLLRQVQTPAEVGSLLLCLLGANDPFIIQRHLLERELPLPYLTAWHPLPDNASSTLLRTLQGHSGDINSCAVSENGRVIVSASDDKTLKVWDGASGEERLTLRNHRAWVKNCAVSGDGQVIVSASRDKMVKVWNGVSGEERLTLLGTDAVTDCTVSGDGRVIVSASIDKTLKVWDGVSGKERLTLRGHTAVVTGCAVSADGRVIVSASADKTLKVWDGVSGKERLALQGHTSEVTDCAVSADGRVIVSASRDKTLKVWDGVSGKERLTLQGLTDVVTDCTVSADGRVIVSFSSYESILKVWDAASGKECLTLWSHTNQIRSCSVSANGRVIVSASADRTLKVWDRDSNKERLTLRGHTDVVTGCTVSGDGRMIVSASRDRTLKVWNAISGGCLLTFPVDGRLSGCAFHPDGRHLIAYGEPGVYFLQLVWQRVP